MYFTFLSVYLWKLIFLEVATRTNTEEGRKILREINGVHRWQREMCIDIGRLIYLY